MKKFMSIFLCVIVSAAFYLSGCRPRILEYDNSGCLSETESAIEDAGFDKDTIGQASIDDRCGEDTIETTIEGTTLYVVHKNSRYNCCPDEIKVSLEVSEEKLKLVEEEILTHPCECTCCFNVETTVVDMNPGTHVLEYCWIDYPTADEECISTTITIPGV